MFLHSIMLIASDRFHQPLALTISKLYKMLETALGRNAFFHLISYNVGQLGRISAFDVYNHLLLHGKENDFLGLWRKRKGNLMIFYLRIFILHHFLFSVFLHSNALLSSHFIDIHCLLVVVY